MSFRTRFPGLPVGKVVILPKLPGGKGDYSGDFRIHPFVDGFVGEDFTIHLF